MGEFSTWVKEIFFEECSDILKTKNFSVQELFFFFSFFLSLQDF